MKVVRNRFLALLMAVAVLSTNVVFASSLPETEDVPSVEEEAERSAEEAGLLSAITAENPTGAAAEEESADTEEPEEQEPDAQEPEVQEPDAQQPEVQEPEEQEPDAQEPEVQEPEVQEPEAQEPEVQEPDAQQPEAQEIKLQEADETDEQIEIRTESDFDALLANAENNGQETRAKLLADVTITHTKEVGDGQNIFLDMDGHALTVVSQETPDENGLTPTMDGIRVSVSGSFSVFNGGMVSDSDDVTLLAVEGGTAEVSDVEFTVNGVSSLCLDVRQGEDSSVGAVAGYMRVFSSELKIPSNKSGAAFVFPGGSLSMKDCTVGENIFALGGQGVSGGSAYLTLDHTSVTATRVGVDAFDAFLTIRDGSVITANADENETNPDANVVAVYAEGSQVEITSQSKLIANGGNCTGIGLRVSRADQDDARSIEISDGVKITATGANAYGVRADESNVTLKDADISANATLYARGVLSESESGNIKALTLSGETEIAAKSDDMAIGSVLYCVDCVIQDSVHIQAEGNDAIGVTVTGGTLMPDSPEVLIEAVNPGSGGSRAAAVRVLVDDAGDAEEIGLKWMQGSAYARSSGGDAYAVQVSLPDRGEYNVVPHAFILPGAGKFTGKVDVEQPSPNEREEDYSSLRISGGIYSQQPDEGFLEEFYTVEPRTSEEERVYEVIGDVAARVYHPGEEDGMSVVDAANYDTLAKALEAAQSGDTVRLYRDAALDKEDMPLIIPAGKELTLEMNGYTISGYGAAGEERGEADKSVFLVEGALDVDAYSSRSAVTDDALNNGGAICNGNSSNSAGGVVVRGTREEPAVFNMSGGEIRDNRGRVGGIEASFASVGLYGVKVRDNIGTETGGIEGTASYIQLGEGVRSVYVTGNSASGPNGVGGIRLSSDPEYPDYGGKFYFQDSVITGNVGKGTGGLEISGGGGTLSSGKISENRGGVTGGIKLTGTAVALGGEGVTTYIQNNTGGFVGGVQVQADDSENNVLNLFGSLKITRNYGNVPLTGGTVENGGASDNNENQVAMNLALYSSEGRLVPFTIFPDLREEREDGSYSVTMDAPAGIYTIVRDGEQAPEDGRMIFRLDDSIPGGGDVYALTGTFTTAFDPDIEYSGYLALDESYYYFGEYSDAWQLDGSYAIERETGGDNPSDMYTLTVNGGTASDSEFEEGDEVTVTADAPAQGKVFDKWAWTGPDLSFTEGTSASSATAKFLMPDTDLSLTASYRDAADKTGGCYVATAVYGSYDCPEVWTLRRFRDYKLARTWYGRLFIRLYYAVSPTAVKLFGNTEWFQSFWRNRLDDMVANLQADGFASTPYQDIPW